MGYCIEMLEAADWYAEFNQLAHLVNLLDGFMSRRDFIETYFQTAVDIQDKNYEDMERWWLEESIESIGTSFHRQTIVLLNTFLELILKEFFKCFFCKHPESMYEYLQVEFESGRLQKGFVSLRVITKARSKNGLIDKLTDDATSNATSGKFASQLRNLESLTKEEIPEDIRHSLLDIVEKRNRIIHEQNHDDVEKIYLVHAIENCKKFLAFLVAVARKKKIVVNLIDGVEG